MVIVSKECKLCKARILLKTGRLPRSNVLNTLVRSKTLHVQIVPKFGCEFSFAVAANMAFSALDFTM